MYLMIKYVMEKSENKLLRKNGLRALEIFSEKLEALRTLNKKLLFKLTEFLRDVFLFDSDVDNILNSLTVLAKNCWVIDKALLKNEGFFVQLISLLRFFDHLKINLNIL